MVGRERRERTDQNYFHCLTARDWGHTRDSRLRSAVKGKNSEYAEQWIELEFVMKNIIFL